MNVVAIVLLDLNIGNDTELGIDNVIKGLGFFTWEGILAVLAGQRVLAEDGGVTAHEGELGVFRWVNNVIHAVVLKAPRST